MLAGEPRAGKTKEDMRAAMAQENLDSCISQGRHGAKSKLLIASASDASKSMTDHEGSVRDR